MSKVSYFQKFSQKENCITNNTLLAFKYIYQFAPKKMDAILQALTESENQEYTKVGLQFENQVNGSNSRPDGCIIQNPINIFIEAKLGNDLYDQQINNHIESIKNTKDIFGRKYLICLTKDTIKPLQKITEEIFVVHTTYKRIIEILESKVENWETDIHEMIEDYKDILGHLIINQDCIMFASPCSATIKLNEKFGIYYDGFDRPKREIANFIGIYADKSIKLVGKIEAVITYGGGIDYEIERHSDLQNQTKLDDYKERIKNIINETQKILGWNLLEKPHRFFITDKFAETNFIKNTKGGLQGLKYFDLANYNITKQDDIVTIGKRLCNKEWSE